MKYKISTLKDIFDKIPQDKIGVCLREIGVMMMHSKFIKESSGAKLIWPDYIEWIDDDKGEINLKINILEPSHKKNPSKGKP